METTYCLFKHAREQNHEVVTNNTLEIAANL